MFVELIRNTLHEYLHVMCLQLEIVSPPDIINLSWYPQGENSEDDIFVNTCLFAD